MPTKSADIAQLEALCKQQTDPASVPLASVIVSEIPFYEGADVRKAVSASEVVFLYMEPDPVMNDAMTGALTIQVRSMSGRQTLSDELFAGAGEV